MSDPVIQAAGVLFLTKAKRGLFVQRAAGGDFAGYWCTPGGKVEGDETPAQAARREATEEIGVHPKGDLLQLSRTRRAFTNPEVVVPTATTGTAEVAPPPLSPVVPALGTIVDYTTFVQRVEEEFSPTLDAESTGSAWADIATPPQPLHPGTAIAIARLGMHELDIARAIASGDLTSGQHYHNMALFAMRITGTGVAYRRGIKEYVYRKPELYLNEDFLARCNGLAVIVEHPKGATLTSAEYQDRNVGSIMLSYIQGDEVWGIAKIYDDTTIRMLEQGQLSTSPSVVFRNPSETNSKVHLDGGEVLLIEGEAALLDHLAICPKGVWDKGGEPRGIIFETRKDDDMTEEELKALEAKKKADAEAEEKAKKDADDKAKADNNAGEILDKVLAACDSISKRMDSYDAKEKERADAEKAKADADEAEKKKMEDELRKKGDPEQVAADKAKKDAEDKEKEEKEKADAAKADADTRASIQALADAMPKPLSDDDMNAMADAQARADDVFSTFGKSAPRPGHNEGPLQYRRRTASMLKAHSAQWKDVDLSTIADAHAFKNIEDAIYADADRAGRSPADLPEDTLREIVKADSTGRRVVSFAGQPKAWMNGFGGNRRRLAGIRNS